MAEESRHAIGPPEAHNPLRDAADLDVAFWRTMVLRGVVTAVGQGDDLTEVEVLLDGQASGTEKLYRKNIDVTFDVADRVLLINTNARDGGWVVLMRY